jgi:hypothetical protein
LNELSLDDFRRAIREKYGCESELVGRERLHEQFDEEQVWEGEVLVFKLLDRPTVTHCYAWEKDGRVSAVLHAGPITSPLKAVRKSILEEVEDSPKHE